jgi:hypothetical protein
VPLTMVRRLAEQLAALRAAGHMGSMDSAMLRGFLVEACSQMKAGHGKLVEEGDSVGGWGWEGGAGHGRSWWREAGGGLAEGATRAAVPPSARAGRGCPQHVVLPGRTAALVADCWESGAVLAASVLQLQADGSPDGSVLRAGMLGGCRPLLAAAPPSWRPWRLRWQCCRFSGRLPAACRPCPRCPVCCARQDHSTHATKRQPPQGMARGGANAWARPRANLCRRRCWPPPACPPTCTWMR